MKQMSTPNDEYLLQEDLNRFQEFCMQLELDLNARFGRINSFMINI